MRMSECAWGHSHGRKFGTQLVDLTTGERTTAHVGSYHLEIDV